MNGQQDPPWQAVPVMYLYFSVIDSFWRKDLIDVFTEPTGFSNSDVKGLEVWLYPDAAQPTALNSFLVSWAMLDVMDKLFTTGDKQGWMIWDIPAFDIISNNQRKIGEIHTESGLPGKLFNSDLNNINTSDVSDALITVDVTFDGVLLDVRSMLMLIFEALWVSWRQKPKLELRFGTQSKYNYGPTATGVRMSLTLRVDIAPTATMLDLTQGLRTLIQNCFVFGRYQSLHGTFSLKDQTVFADVALWFEPPRTNKTRGANQDMFLVPGADKQA
ncbi:uncharacterized protein KY384_004622 [Bacidia gigantensis]|uniref:uncharacterized protein n=1 Tax=Bacidia gigantensis TaxID=2732470 RepID=UPI001D04D07B|nr:uncharacterized protein KY384_004622 [Bacidia gigantensis]KAG8531264.1 hypothetical protein KY384_004622 [Bacidia gigantensis]